MNKIIKVIMLIIKINKIKINLTKINKIKVMMNNNIFVKK